MEPERAAAALAPLRALCATLLVRGERPSGITPWGLGASRDRGNRPHSARGGIQPGRRGAVSGLNGRTDRLARTAVVILVSMLALGGVVFALLTSPYFDEIQYWQMGRSLLHTGVYSLTPGGPPTTYKVPGVPIALAATQTLGLDFTASRVLFALLLLPLGAWLAWRWLTSLGVPKQASACAVAFAFANPALIVSSGTLYPQFAVGVAYLGAIAAWSASERRNAKVSRWLLALVAGLALGLSVMLASTAVVVIAAMLVWVLWRARRRSARGEARLGVQLASVGIVAVGVCLVVAPWLVRNASVTGRFPLMGTSAGITLLEGNAPASTVDNGPEMRFTGDDNPPAGLSEVAQDEFFRARALDHIRTQPIYYGRLYLAKVAYGLWPTAVTATKGPNAVADVLQRFYYGLLYLGLLAWVFAKKRLALAHPWIVDIAPYLNLGILMATASLLSYAAFFTRLRYRLPTDIPLGLFAGLSAYLLFVAWTERRGRRDTPTR